jgi:dipeptidase
MDLLRLALERSKNANQALEIITSLLEKYGQGGSASQKDPSYIYHNSFIIADKKEAWVLETADKIWVAEKVKDVRTISNGYTIEKWDKSSTDIVEFAINRGLCDSKEEFNFIECFSDPVPREATNCVERQKHTTEFLLDNKGKINISMAMKLLRSHDSKGREEFNPARSGMTICMHYSVKALSQTVNSMISHLSDIYTHWFTGISAPCISLFKPIFLKEIGLPPNYKLPGETYDPDTLWWEHEKLHRLILQDYQNRSPIVQEKYTIEEKFITELNSIIRNNEEETELNKILREFSQYTFEKQYQILNDLITLITNKPIDVKTSKIYLKKWRKLSENVNL